MMSVAVVISELNSAKTIERCLRSLSRQDYPKEATRIIIIDGGSVDGTVKIIERFLDERTTLVVAPGKSEAQGHIEALKLVDSEAVLFTNSDIYAPRDWISRHVRQLGQYPIIGGRLFWGGDDFTKTWNMATPLEGTWILWSLVKAVQKKGFGLGFSNCAIRASVLREIGLADLKGHQDTMLAFKAIKRGHVVYTDFENIAFHDHPFRSVRGSYFRSVGYSRNHVIVYRLVFGGYLLPKERIARKVSLAAGIGMFQEVAQIGGTRAWKEWNGDIRMSLLRFLALRFFGFSLGFLVGVLQGIFAGDVSSDSISDLHAQRTATKK